MLNLLSKNKTGLKHIEKQLTKGKNFMKLSDMSFVRNLNMNFIFYFSPPFPKIVLILSIQLIQAENLKLIHYQSAI